MFNRNSNHKQDYYDEGGRSQEAYAEGYDYQRAGQRFTLNEARSVEMDTESQAVFNQTMRKVFAWMFLGLGITALTSFLAINIPALFNLVYSTGGMIALIIGQLALAFAFGFSMWRVRPAILKAMFAGYAAVLGLTLSSIFLVYTSETIFLSFAVSAAVFGTMAAVGYFIKKDLTPLGYAGYMLLFGAIIVTLINVVLSFIVPGFAQTLSWIMNYVILAIFIGLTAYDMQRIKMMAVAAVQEQRGYTSELAVTTDRIALYGAMQLYLDFINIFLRVLAIMGRSRD